MHLLPFTGMGVEGKMEYPLLRLFCEYARLFRSAVPLFALFLRCTDMLSKFPSRVIHTPVLLEQTGKYPRVVICFPRQSRIQSIPVKALFCALVERADGESARNVIANGHNNIHCHRLQIRDLSLTDGFLNVETIRENSSRANLGRR